MVFTLLAAVVYGLIGWATRRWDVASFVVALGVFAIVGWAVAVLIAALVGWWLVLIWRSRRQQGWWDVTRQLSLPLNLLV
ncbi:MAG TPA: hypothetical protein VFJ00_00005, partial [Candidatus Limnocylindria bacterium]|nr:hypothetical protein [Candidatus Limnocylindria bacterium]